MDIYHGSNKIIEKPQYGFGNIHNDYGLGFYCTEYEELACEWAVSEQSNGYSNHYELDTNGLKILTLNDANYHILNWLAILLKNRVVDFSGDISKRGFDYIISEFLIDYSDYDMIKGYRADDSYFSFVRAFLNNSISLETLNVAMYLGELGEQVVLMSENAFNNVKYLESKIAYSNIYFKQKMERDNIARTKYIDIKTSQEYDQTFLLDIVRGKWKNDDSRIQRIIHK